MLTHRDCKPELIRPRRYNIMFEHFCLALSFYTRIPSPMTLDYQKLPPAAVYLPIIGWLVGGISALSFYAAHLLWTQTTAVILALATGVLLTGAFHEDGFADVCDGFGGGYDPQRILAIMKDSHIGVYGVLGLLLLFSLKISVLSVLPANFAALSLLAAHSSSRFLPLLLMWQYDYTRTGHSKAGSAAYRPNRTELLTAAGCATAPLLLLPPLCLVALCPMLAANFCLGRYFYRHIGGYTGDCLGASQQLGELVFYLTVQALWTFI